MIEEENNLESQIRDQVSRIGKAVAGEFDEASEAGLALYPLKVQEAVEHLESLCQPLIDEEYKKQKNDLNEAKTRKRKIAQEKTEATQLAEMLEESKEKYSLLVELCYRKGVL